MIKIPVICAECGKKFKVSAMIRISPECPRCGSVDIDVREDIAQEIR